MGSVKFALDGQTVSVETYAPYDLLGDANGKPIAWTPAAGSQRHDEVA